MKKSKNKEEQLNVPESLKGLSRRHLRQYLFIKKRFIVNGKEDDDTPLPDWFEDAVSFYEEQDNFTDWNSFAAPFTDDEHLRCYGAWDIGIDDKFTANTRPEKNWLFNTSRFEVVLRGERKDSLSLLDLEIEKMKNLNRLIIDSQ